MTSLQDQLLQELRNTPPSLLQQILDFVRFLKQQYQIPFVPAPHPPAVQPPEIDRPDLDSIVGLYSGSPNLSEQAEDILEANLGESGWTWKA